MRKSVFHILIEPHNDLEKDMIKEAPAIRMDYGHKDVMISSNKWSGEPGVNGRISPLKKKKDTGFWSFKVNGWSGRFAWSYNRSASDNFSPEIHVVVWLFH